MSWEPAKDWYDNLVGKDGHYYHQQIIIPNVVKKILDSKAKSVIDIACGQGILSRKLPGSINYLGVDISKSLIDAANERNKKSHKFIVGDATDLQVKEKFDLATIILAIQDIDHLEKALESAKNVLKPGSKLIIVLNHPCFRIPRQSSWEMNVQSKLQARKLQVYMSPLDIPIQTNPGLKGKSANVTHHHRPLSAYFAALKKSGFLVENLEEWCSDKLSSGKFGKAENRARKEFPLFMCLDTVLSS